MYRKKGLKKVLFKVLFLGLISGWTKAPILIIYILFSQEGQSFAKKVTRVCVEVQVKRGEEKEKEDKKKAEKGISQPKGQLPFQKADLHSTQRARSLKKPSSFQKSINYLKRLLEHFISHEKGFVAKKEDCDQFLVVELYPLTYGWSAFGRYTGFRNEEMVPYIEEDEWMPFAERMVSALLYNKSIDQTIKRHTVLRADSKEALRKIQPADFFLFSFGTTLMYGKFNTVQGIDDTEKVSREGRFFNPLTFNIGYRGISRILGIDAFFRTSIGTGKKAAKSNLLGGHTDFSGDIELGLHLLHYLSGKKASSFYWGGGSLFRLMWFSIIRPVGKRERSFRDYVFGGGLSLNLLAGYEFLRFSPIRFLVQVECSLPIYIFEGESSSGSISTWIPTWLAHFGIML
jgi:hypothetical protein